MGAGAMKTSLHFEAPSDLSVGTIRITGHGQRVTEWVATPDNRIFQQQDLKPGIYSAEIAPAGVAPQAVVFEVREGQANNVVLPSFSALSSSGSNTSFFDTRSQRAVSEFPYSINADAFAEPHLLQTDRIPRSGVMREQISETERTRRVDVSAARRRISIGLSQEARGRETFDVFRGEPKIELLSGRLQIEIPTDLRRDQWAGDRVRLSVAIEASRIERCLLPLYRGGTRITVAAPAFDPADVEFSVMPADPMLRALVRVLDAGTSTEAEAVSTSVLGKKDLAALLRDDAGPWSAILVGLLAIRFPGVFQPIEATWAEKLAERAGWAFDTHVIRASQALSAAAAAALDAQNEAVSKAVISLANAQVAGSPYYRYTNQIFGDMAAGIASYLEAHKPRIDNVSRERFERLYRRWRRELPLQRGAEWTFTWLARDPAALKQRRILAPYRHASGRLRSRDTAVVFEGRVGAGQIDIISGSRSARWPELVDGADLSRIVKRASDTPQLQWSQMPALQRPPGPSDDPNKGRFGREASQGGFSLTAAFEKTKNPDWVVVILTVEVNRATDIQIGDFAWFVLHPTFSPPVLKVAFRGRRARLRIQCWGGFTVGIWLPSAGVELEVDLAKIENAPRIIRER